MSKAVRVVFTDILDYKSGNSALTKAYMNEHAGNYPVYSAKTVGETKVGEIDTYMFDIEGLQLTTNGANAGTWLYRHKHKFSLNGDARLYFLKKEYQGCIDIKYLYYSLRIAFSKKEFDWNTKATLNNTQNVKISIPVLSDGKYDINTQIKLAKRYDELEKKRRILLAKVEELRKTKITVKDDDNIKYSEVLITHLFTPKGGDMTLSKSYCQEHVGNYPVYSGSSNREIFGSINDFKYDGEYLTWVIDGLAGYVMKLSGRFSITCHRGILIPTEECKNIDLSYIKYMIEPIFRKRARGRIGINGKNEYTALKPTHIKNYNDSVLIPVDENGQYDLIMQQELARKYAAIETIKEDIYSQIKSLTSVVVN